MLKQNRVNLSERSDKLQQVQQQVHQAISASGLVDDNCHTVCEDQLVIVNGQLQHQVVCHTVCDD